MLGLAPQCRTIDHLCSDVFSFPEYLSRDLVGYDMTSNPSYGTSVATSDYMAGKTYTPSSVISFSNPMYNNYAAFGGAGAGSSAYKKRSYQSTGITAASGGGEREAGRSHYGVEGRSHYLETSASKKYGNSKLRLLAYRREILKMVRGVRSIFRP